MNVNENLCSKQNSAENDADVKRIARPGQLCCC